MNHENHCRRVSEAHLWAGPDHAVIKPETGMLLLCEYEKLGDREEVWLVSRNPNATNNHGGWKEIERYNMRFISYVEWEKT